MVGSRLAAASLALAALAQAVPSGLEKRQSVASSGPVITVDATTKYQVYDGIGLSEAFQRSKVLNLLNDASQALALDLLFSNKTGAGFQILRNGLGSSPDDPFDLMKSIEPNAPASNSSRPTYTPLRSDEEQVWLSHEAISRGVYKIYADAWSADGYMKTQGTDFNGGYLCGVTNATCATGDWRQAYANKIVKYIQLYASEGITVDYVGFLNEPDLNTTYASMQSNGQQAADFLKILYPTIQAAGLPTKIICCDGSGWEQQRSRLIDIQKAGYEDTLDVISAHGYSSAPTTPFQTSKRVWQTEWSTFDPLNHNWYATGSQSEGLTWANHIHNAFAVSNVSAMFYWWGAANTTDNQSLIIVNGTNTISVTKRLWAYAHYGSRLVHPGAWRVGTTITHPDAANSLNVTAFLNGDGSTAIQVINNGAAQQTVTLKGLPLAAKADAVITWLTNQANDFTQGYPLEQDRDGIVANVPAKSLLSFLVAAEP